MPIRQARPEVVEIDDVLQHVRRQGARRARATRWTATARGWPAADGTSTRRSTALRPLVTDLEPVAANLATRRRGSAASSRRSADAAAEVAPVAEEQASLFVNLDTTFTALASSPGPFLQESISEGPPTRGASRSASSRASGRSCATTRPSSRELRPGVATLPHSAPILADAFEAGTEILPKTPPMNARPGRRLRHAGRTSRTDPLVRGGVDQLTRLSSSLKPTLKFLTPVADHLQLRDALLPQRRRACSRTATRTAPGSASRSSRPLRVSGPEPYERSTTRSGRRAAPPTARRREPPPHEPLSEHGVARARPKECEAGNERYA